MFLPTTAALVDYLGRNETLVLTAYALGLFLMAQGCYYCIHISYPKKEIEERKKIQFIFEFNTRNKKN